MSEKQRDKHKFSIPRDSWIKLWDMTFRLECAWKSPCCWLGPSRGSDAGIWKAALLIRYSAAGVRGPGTSVGTTDKSHSSNIKDGDLSETPVSITPTLSEISRVFHKTSRKGKAFLYGLLSPIQLACSLASPLFSSHFSDHVVKTLWV